MKSILCYLLNFFILISAAVIPPPLLLLNGHELASTTTNVPVATSLDARFTITARFEGPLLHLIPCLMSTVQLLVKLGVEDFWANMAKTSIKFHDYAHVGVIVSPELEGGRIDIRFVIWGLGSGVAHMIRSNRFQEVTFALAWEGREVGTIELVAWPTTQYTTQTIHTNSTQTLTLQSNLSLVQDPSSLPASTKDTNTALENAHMTLRASLTGSTVQVFDVFLLAIAVLVDVAPLPFTHSLQTYNSPLTAANVVIAFTEPTPARTSAPFFEVHWLMKAMALIPEYMIEKGKFQEAYALIEVDGVRVANGFLGSKEDGGGMANVKGNVSVS